MADEYRAPPVHGVPPVGNQRRHQPRRQGGYPPGAGGAAPPHDAASVAGIPEHMLTPEVQQAMVRLMETIDQLNAELDLRRHVDDMLDQAAQRHDVLPLLNRRGLAREVVRIATHMAQGGMGGSFVLLHVGGIERLRLGHGLAAADAALAHVAGMFAGLRQSDLAACLGGSDFALVLALAEAADADRKVLELVDRINRPPLRWDHGDVVLPASWGIVPMAADSTLDRLLAAADAVRS